MKRLIATMAAFTLAVLLSRRDAHADALSVRTIEFGSWPAAVAALEGNLRSDGRTVRVFVRDESGRPVACGDYTLMLDAIAQQAFVLGACDPQTSATDVRLVNRHALFAHDDIVPRPLPAGISAVELRTTGSRGGAGHVGGSDLQCTLALRPYLTNLETGEHVYLTPGRFVMNVISHEVNAVATQQGWMLRAHTYGQLTVEYEIHDTQRGERVLHDRVSLRCGVDNASSAGETSETSSAIEGDPFVRIDPRLTPRPAIREGGRSCRDAPLLSTRGYTASTTHGGAAVPMFRVDVPYTTTLRLHLSSGFGGELFWYRGCGNEGSLAQSAVFGGGYDQVIRFPLEPGTYYLAVVDADIHSHEGSFSMQYEAPPDIFADDDETAP
jgi:hypothetical protein